MSLATQISALATRIGTEIKLLSRKANNLSDLANRQTALNNLTNVSAATGEQVLTKDTATGNAVYKDGGGDTTGSDIYLHSTYGGF